MQEDYFVIWLLNAILASDILIAKFIVFLNLLLKDEKGVVIVCINLLESTILESLYS
jgi:hypothetical protein